MKTGIRINLDVLLESRGITRYELAKRTGIQYILSTTIIKTE
ncbi:helix-turn-helix domain-containing protein [Acutalibacter sp. JLR.KK004]|jgi:DNA-binding Xre family transcriptional regulator